ncbi:hypothetical protein [Streptomyces sp. NPDC091416]|uniref:hypothetical protein n=1 Tax=Streptomyces sp. NPDC091416 TaxID=3366003 RepID=UPI0038258662
MRTTVPTNLTAAQLDGLACFVCGADDTEQRPTGDRSPSGVQLFACTDPDVCRAQRSVNAQFPRLAALRAEAQSAPVFEEHPHVLGVPVMFSREGAALRASFDPAQTTLENARELIAEANALYPGARAVAFTNIGCTVITSLPADELPARIEQRGKGRCVVMYDDTRISSDQLLALLDKVAGR